MLNFNFFECSNLNNFHITLYIIAKLFKIAISYKKIFYMKLILGLTLKIN